jgi:hypothetical protein
MKYLKIQTLLFISPHINDNYNKSEFKITNTGMEPVTNLSMTIQSPLKIKSIINIFSTTTITFFNLYNYTSEKINLNQVLDIEKENLNLFMLKVPILRQGGGDIIKFQIETIGDPYQSCFNYQISMVFDKGSQNFRTNECIDPIVKFLRDLIHEFNVYSWTIFLAIIVIVFLLFYAYIPYIRKIIQRSFVSGIRKDLLETYCKLKRDSKYSHKLPCRENWIELEKKYSKEAEEYRSRFSKLIRKDRFDKRELFDVQDYILIDDYYKKVEERNELIDKEKEETKQSSNKKILDNCIVDMNMIILYLAENALERFNWNKYIPQRPEFTTFTKSEDD